MAEDSGTVDGLRESETYCMNELRVWQKVRVDCSPEVLQRKKLIFAHESW